MIQASDTVNIYLGDISFRCRSQWTKLCWYLYHVDSVPGVPLALPLWHPAAMADTNGCWPDGNMHLNVYYVWHVSHSVLGHSNNIWIKFYPTFCKKIRVNIHVCWVKCYLILAHFNVNLVDSQHIIISQFMVCKMFQCSPFTRCRVKFVTSYF